MKIGRLEVLKPSYPPILWLAEWKMPAPFNHATLELSGSGGAVGGEDFAISRDDNVCQLWLVVYLKFVTTLPSLPFQRITSPSVRTVCKQKLLKKSIIKVVALLRSFEHISELGSQRLLLVRLDRLWLLWLLSTLAITNLPPARCHHSHHLYLWPIFVTVLYLNLYLCFS